MLVVSGQAGEGPVEGAVGEEERPAGEGFGGGEEAEGQVSDGAALDQHRLQ